MKFFLIPVFFFAATTFVLPSTRFGEIPLHVRDWTRIHYLEEDFYLLNTEQIPDNGTKIKIAYDKRFLYIKAVCYEKRMDNVITSYTGNDIWRNDCIEIFIDTNLDRQTYYYFIVSVDGQIYGWNTEKATILEWDAVTRKKDARWEAEIKIPFSLLDVKPARGRTLFMSFCRERWAEGVQLSTWTPPRGFHRPREFGVLVMGTYKNALSFYLNKMKEETEIYAGKKKRDIPERVLEKICLWENIIEKGELYNRTRYVSKDAFKDWWTQYEEAKRAVNLQEVMYELKIENLLFGN